jgi:outer membrane protein assembly factor BamB
MKLDRAANAIVLLSLTLLLVVPSNLLTSSAASPAAGDWTMFNFNYINARSNPTSTITSSTVGALTQKWHFTTPAFVTSQPVVSNGVVYFADWAGNVYALTLSGGKPIWKTNVGGNISDSLTLANGILYGGMNPQGPVPKVFALNAATGKTVWKITITNTNETSVWASPVVYKNMVIIGIAGYGPVETNTSKAGEIVALNAQTGSMIWSFKTGISKVGGAAVWGTVGLDKNLGTIYFGTGNAYTRTRPPSSAYSYSILSLNAATGKKIWNYTAYTFNGDKDFGSSPNLFAIPGHKALGLGGKDGIYYVLDRSTGQLLHKFNLSAGVTGQGITGVASFTYTTNLQTPEVFIPVNYDSSVKCCANITAVLPASNSIAWKFKALGPLIVGSVTGVPGAILFGDTGGNFYALSTATGAVLYHAVLPSAIGAGITASEGYVLVPVGTLTYSLPGTQFGLYAYN